MAAVVTARRPEPTVDDALRVAVPRPGPVGAVVTWSVSLAGVAIVGFVAFLVVGSSAQAHRAQQVMFGQLGAKLQDATAPVSGTIRPGTPIGVIEIPRIGLQRVFVQGSTSEQTAVGPGLSSDSVLPGEQGLALLVGRRATFGADFRHLDRLSSGDRIIVTTGLGRFQFKVDLARRSDDPASKIQLQSSRLTLVTSDPALAPNRQIIVSAVLLGTPQPASVAPLGREGERPGEHSLNSAIVVLLWTQLLVLVVWVVTKAGLRFPKRAIWVGAVPVVLAILWHIFEGVAAVLPNTL